MESQILHGNCVDVLAKLPEEFADLVITSPPYNELRDYNGYEFDCEKIVKALFRSMKKGGVVVWVVGDAVINGSETGTSFRQALTFIDNGFKLHDTMIYEKNTSSFPARRDGNRYTQIFEYCFIFSKNKPKTVNLICDKPNKWVGHTNWGKKTERSKDGELKVKKNIKPVKEFSPRNNIWRYVVGGGFGQKDKDAYKHPATFPEQLVYDHIQSWSNEGDMVLDPMCGSSTTGKVALENNRKYIGIDISEDYCILSHNRTKLPIIKEFNH